MNTHTRVELCAFVIVPLDTSVGGDPNNTSEISSKDSLLKKPRDATKKILKTQIRKTRNCLAFDLLAVCLREKISRPAGRTLEKIGTCRGLLAGNPALTAGCLRVVCGENSVVGFAVCGWLAGGSRVAREEKSARVQQKKQRNWIKFGSF